MFRLLLASVALLAGNCSSVVLFSAESASFKSDVAPIFLENCLACHGPKKAEGGYRIDTFDELQKPGDSGAMPLVKNDAAKSELLRRLTCTDADERMPAEADPLSAEEIGIIRKWFDAGALFDGDNSKAPLSLVIPPRTYTAAPEHYSMSLPVTALAFSANGTEVIASGYHELTVWNATDGTLIRRIGNVGERTQAIVVLSDGKTLAVGCGEPGRTGEVRLFDYETGTLKGTIARTTDLILDIAQRPNSPEIAVGAADSMIRIVNTETMAEVRSIASHADWVTSIAWSDDGRKLASTSRDKSVKVFDVESGELTANYQGHAAPSRGVAFTTDGKQILSGGSDNKLHRWDIEGAKRVAVVDLGGEPFKLIRGDGLVLLPTSNKEVRQIELTKNSVQRNLTGHQDWVTAIAVEPKLHRVASGSMDGEIRLWNADDGTLVKSWAGKP